MPRGIAPQQYYNMPKNLFNSTSRGVASGRLFEEASGSAASKVEQEASPKAESVRILYASSPGKGTRFGLEDDPIFTPSPAKAKVPYSDGIASGLRLCVEDGKHFVMQRKDGKDSVYIGKQEKNAKSPDQVLWSEGGGGSKAKRIKIDHNETIAAHFEKPVHIVDPVIREEALQELNKKKVKLEIEESMKAARAKVIADVESLGKKTKRFEELKKRYRRNKLREVEERSVGTCTEEKYTGLNVPPLPEPARKMKSKKNSIRGSVSSSE
ncbi:unnamed protein product [Amoebophrya sp. A25]|nr:unnamed protein product [Amoebophrya sp. A25]|eukprot:GSA25T00020187001.1